MVKDFLAYKAQATELKEVSDLAYGELVLAQAAALAGQWLQWYGMASRFSASMIGLCERLGKLGTRVS